MLQYIKTYKDFVVFSQWSRKTYAAFASLNKVVSIGYLSIDIYKHAVLKREAFDQLSCIINKDNYKRMYCNIISMINKSVLVITLLAAKNNNYNLEIFNKK